MNEFNSTLDQSIEPDNELKDMLVQYVGVKHTPEDGNVTIEMIIDTLAEEFPEFLFAVAEENWIRGYQQGLDDVEAGRLALENQNEERECSRACEKEK